MELKTCSQCKKLFNYAYGPEICKDCYEKAFDVVYSYLKENPRTNINELAEATKISSKIIALFLKDERLQVYKSNLGYDYRTCVICGLPITGGSYCSKCKRKSELANQLNDEYADSNKNTLEKVKKISIQMYTYKKKK